MSSAAAPAPSWYVSLLVRHPKWGLGKIVHISGSTLSIYFRDLSEEEPGDARKMINPRHGELRIAEVQSDRLLDNVPPFVDGKVPYSKPRLTLEQQTSIFKNIYPLAFGDPTYLKERNSNWNAHLAYVEQLGKGQCSKLLESHGPNAVSETVLRVIRKSHYLHKHEYLAFQNALADHGSNGTRAFFESLFSLVELAKPTRHDMDLYFAAVRDLSWFASKSSPTWPVATILPYLADPSRFMLLKPEVTRQAAYPSALDPRMSVCCWRLPPPRVGRTSHLLRPCMRIQSNRVQSRRRHTAVLEPSNCRQHSSLGKNRRHELPGHCSVSRYRG